MQLLPLKADLVSVFPSAVALAKAMAGQAGKPENYQVNPFNPVPAKI